MLIISECRFCNKDKSTCEIKLSLRDRLQKSGITEPLKYKCGEWKKHLKYQIGDEAEFHFIERDEDSYGGYAGTQHSGETVVGKIIEVSKRKPIYFVRINQENRNKIDPDWVSKKYIDMIMEEEDWEAYVGDGKTGFFQLPVKESLIVNIVTNEHTNPSTT